MSYTTTELKAISSYAKNYKLRIALSTGNTINFQEIDSQGFVKKELDEIMKEYLINKLANDREARRLKQVNNSINKRNIPYKEAKK